MNNSTATQLSKQTVIQFLRYVAVGVFSNVVGYLIYLYITHLGVPPKLAMTGLYAISAGISFFGNRQISFEHKGVLSGAALRFIIAHLCGYSLNLAALVVFVDRLGYPYQIVQAIAIIVVALFLFVVFKYFVFKDTPDLGRKAQ